MVHAPRSRFIEYLEPGDLVIANDAATLPASLHGVHVPSGAEIEVRLAGYTTNRRSEDQEGFCSSRKTSPGLLISCSKGTGRSFTACEEIAPDVVRTFPPPLACPTRELRRGSPKRHRREGGRSARHGRPEGLHYSEFFTGSSDRPAVAAAGVQAFSAVVFGAGDFRTRTEDRPPPPTLAPGDRLVFPAAPSDAAGLGPSGVAGLTATIEALVDHPRLVSLRFSGLPHAVWAGLARHGRPIQYAHVPAPLALWDVWTPIAGLPVAFEAPSAGFALDWATIRSMRERGIAFATITLAAGISSTGDPELDRRLPFDEPYRIPDATASAIRRARSDGGRIIAIGTTVVRALEHAAARAGVVSPGEGIADHRLGPSSRLRVADAILSGTHEPGSGHYQLLRAFLDDATLAEASAALEAMGYRTHEFGDSVLIEKSHSRNARRPLEHVA
jgi:S-adenosylmethionine:tRNA ribosyltransferase-isomerase